VQWWAKLGFIVALAAGVLAPVAGLAGLDPIELLDRSGLQSVGAGVAVIGIVATALAQLQMGVSWRIGVDPSERTGLVTDGVFAWVRNPIFTAMLIAAAGFTLLVGNWVAIAGFVALVVALEVQVRLVEEPYLLTAHGAAYRTYAGRSGRFVPQFGRL
jgi:protein-S-isoprenylcysteine O-methyltransferase Ste14